MIYLAIILIIICVFGLYFCPSLDYTREGWILLWYGNNPRKYIKLFHIGK